MNDDLHWYQVPHKFKAEEWACSKKELIQALADYQKEEWTQTNVDHFLECYFHLPSGFIELHHTRCVWTLIKKGVVERYVRRLCAVEENTC